MDLARLKELIDRRAKLVEALDDTQRFYEFAKKFDGGLAVFNLESIILECDEETAIIVSIGMFNAVRSSIQNIDGELRAFGVKVPDICHPFLSL